MLRLPLLIFLHRTVLAEMEGFVVDGERVNIEEVPHSVFMKLTCHKARDPYWICGGSILTRYLTLTAAHCVQDCDENGFISVSVGHEHKKRGYVASAVKYKVHEDFDHDRMEADIALVKLRSPLKLGNTVKRVILMRSPPRVKEGYVAGWGLTDEINKKFSPWLKRAMQVIWNPKACERTLTSIPKNVLCAYKINGYSAAGDSGSALMIKDHIQIGIVSYKETMISRSLVVYTNVSSYYDWITKSSKALYCG